MSTKKLFPNRSSITCISGFLCTRISNLSANEGNAANYVDQYECNIMEQILLWKQLLSSPHDCVFYYKSC